MSNYIVKSSDKSKITLNETEYVNSVLQNIRVLISTWQGEVTLYRNFGVNPEILHKPINVAESMLVADLTEKIETYEPRARVLDISVSASGERPDVLNIEVEVEIEDEP